MPSFYTIAPEDGYKVSANAYHYELVQPKVINIIGDSPEAVFQEAALWLQTNPYYTVVGTSFTYLSDDEAVQLTLTVE